MEPVEDRMGLRKMDMYPDQSFSYTIETPVEAIQLSCTKCASFENWGMDDWTQLTAARYLTSSGNVRDMLFWNGVLSDVRENGAAFLDPNYDAEQKVNFNLFMIGDGCLAKEVKFISIDKTFGEDTIDMTPQPTLEPTSSPTPFPTTIPPTPQPTMPPTAPPTCPWCAEVVEAESAELVQVSNVKDRLTRLRASSKGTAELNEKIAMAHLK